MTSSRSNKYRLSRKELYENRRLAIKEYDTYLKEKGLPKVKGGSDYFDR